VPALQQQMLQCYSRCEAIAAVLMRLFAVGLGVEQQYFIDKLHRHHSNMQVRSHNCCCCCTLCCCCTGGINVSACRSAAGPLQAANMCHDRDCM
jgi:hypothetical protein